MRALPLFSVGWAWLALALAWASNTQLAAAEAPPVKVQLRASWPRFSLPSGGSPFLLELLEAAKSQRPSSFFDLIKILTHYHTATELRQASDEWLFKTVENLFRAHELFGMASAEAQEWMDAWSLSLALRNSSPKIQAFAQLYQTLGLDDVWQAGHANSSCDSWVHHQGRVLCSAEELDQALRSSSGAQPDQQKHRGVTFGHVHPPFNTAMTDTQSFTLYADPYSDNFQELFSVLYKKACNFADKFAFTLRWRLSSQNDKALASSPSGNQTNLLSGYGAILDLKKVDYLVIDDRRLKDDSEISEVGVSAGEEGEAAYRASEDLHWLRDQIGANTEASTPASLSSLTEGEIADLGIKAARLIMGSSDPLRALQELSQNFPSHAAALASSTNGIMPMPPLRSLTRCSVSATCASSQVLPMYG